VDTAQTIREFVVESFLYGAEDEGLTADASLLGAGYVDSTGVLEIIAFLEKTFGIAVEDEEMIPANLDSVARMVAYVERKRGEGA
jgi:acyl carrier protein